MRKSPRRFFPWTFVLSVFLWGVALPTLSLLAQNKPSPPRYQLVLEQNGFFYGEEQFYVVVPPVIHVYSPLIPEAEVTSGKETLQGNQLPSRSRSANGDYHHEVFRLVEGKWTKGKKSLSRKPDSYLNASACDSANKLDVPSASMMGALPHPIRLKAVESREDYAVAVYSDTPDRTEFYSLKTALLTRESDGWHVVDTVSGGEAVNFCGLDAFRTRLEDGQEPTVFLVYLGDINSKSRYFVSIQGFLVRDVKNQVSKQKLVLPN